MSSKSDASHNEERGNESGETGTTPNNPLSSIGRSIGRHAMRTQSFENPLGSPEKPAPNTLPNDTVTSTSPSQYAVYSPTKRRAPPTPSEQSAGSNSNHATSPTSSSHTPPPQFSATAAARSIPPLVSRPSNSTLPYTQPPPRHPASVRTGRPYARSVSEAQEMLLGQALKAELQTLLGGTHGNASESWGTAMATALGAADESIPAGEWTDVLGALQTGKFTLLLPAENMPAGATVTPALVREHLAVFEDEDEKGPLSPSAENARGFATLGGLRGVLTCAEVMLRAKAGSSLDYLDPEIRRQTLGAPSVYPSSQVLTAADSTLFPFNEVLSPFTTLSVPRSSRASAAHFAALSRQSTGSRLAALFAKQPAASPQQGDSDLPPVVQAPEGILDSISSSQESSDPSASARSSSRNLELRILAVAKAVQRPAVSAAIAKSLKLYIQQQLMSLTGLEGSPGLREGVGAFVSRFSVPSASTTSASASNSKTSRGWDSVEEAADGWVDLTEALRPAIAQTLGCDTEASAVDERLEQIEAIVMEAIYDRVFDSPTSSDGVDDDLLKRRINMLRNFGVGLEHLGIDIESEGGAAWDDERLPMREALENVAVLVGNELSKLDKRDSRSPRSKLDVFVNMHKIIVEQLSGLPPIPLKKEISHADRDRAEAGPAEVEMDDASSRTGTNSKASSRPLSPTLDEQPERPLRTRNPPSVAAEALPRAGPPNPELALSVYDATSSSMFDRHDSPRPSPPPSVFESSRTNSRRESAAPSPSASSSSSADLILPILINAVINHRPTIPLVSHLKFALRFRAESLLRGEMSYCATNVSAVLEFLQTVDLPSLGIGGADGVASQTLPTAAPARATASPSTTRPGSVSSGRTSISFIVRRPQSVQDIDQFVDSANHALVRAADLLFGPRGLAPKTIEDVKNVLDGAGSVASKARGSILRRATLSGGSGPTATKSQTTDESEPKAEEVNGLKASMPSDQSQREMVDFVAGSGDAFDAGTTTEYSAETNRPTESLQEDTSKPAAEDDARSIRSISSLIRDSTLVGKLSGHIPGTAAIAGTHSDESQRQSLSGRFAANIPGLSRFSSESRATGTTASGAGVSGIVPSSSRTSLFAAFAGGGGSGGSPTSSRRNTVNGTAAPVALPNSPSSSSGMLSFFSGSGSAGTTVAAVQKVDSEDEPDVSFQPSARFLMADADDLKLGEVQSLLSEYKRAARVLQALRQRKDVDGQGDVGDARVPDTTVAVQTE